MKKLLALTFVLGMNVAMAQDSLYHIDQRIYGIELNSDGILFHVPSSGCTSKKDFHVNIAESVPVQVSIARHRLDVCKAYIPEGTKLFYSYKELGLKGTGEFVFTNTFKPRN